MPTADRKTQPLQKPLNEKQMLALRHVATGETNKAAGIAAGYTPRSASTCVTRLVNDPKGASYLARLRQESESKAIASITERKELLTKIARADDKETTADRLRAIDTLNRMDSVYTTQIEADVNHRGGVMLVPATSNLSDWTEAAASSQAALMANAIEVSD